jgi:predicted nucleic acid-binding protein
MQGQGGQALGPAGATYALEMDALALLVRLASAVPPQRQHQTRYAGVLAAAAHWRPLIEMGTLEGFPKTPPRVDLMIAATALELGATLVTYDDDLLSAPIPELAVVDWFTPPK